MYYGSHWLQLTATSRTGVIGARAVKPVGQDLEPGHVHVYLPNTVGHIAARMTERHSNVC